MSKLKCILKATGTLWAWILLSIIYVLEIAALSLLIILFFENIISYIVGSLLFVILFIAYIQALENRNYTNKYQRWWNNMKGFFKGLGIAILFVTSLLTAVYAFVYIITYFDISAIVGIALLILLVIIITVAYVQEKCY
jgi:hypothetical protein